jgi:quinone-modifying oxidoreductase subunit QmoC
MIWAGWGLKDRLIGNVDVWLCHQCGDCSSSCPRDIRPSDVIAAVRQKSYEHYARPRFMGKLMSNPAWLPLAISIPVGVIIAILSLAGTFRIPEGEVDYSSFFPHAWLNISFAGITLVFYTLGALGIASFLKDMKRLFHPEETKRNKKAGFFSVMGEIVAHSNFSDCGSQSTRKIAHMLLFFGFGLLMLVTLYAIWATISDHYPLPLTDPFKIVGNLASLMIYTGLVMMVYQRIFRKKVFGRSSYTDWLLLISVALLTVSGTLVEAARFLNWTVAYHLYFFHLVSVWFVIIYLPFTKLGHIFYRTTALVYARSIGRR